MKRSVALRFLALILVPLTACAPLPALKPGQAADLPVIKDSPLSSVLVRPGETVYAQYNYPRGLLDKDSAKSSEWDKYFDAMKFDYTTFQASTGTLQTPVADASWLRLAETDAPQGVRVSVVKVMIARPVSKATRDDGAIDIKYREVFQITYKITVDANYKPVLSKELLKEDESKGKGEANADSSSVSNVLESIGAGGFTFMTVSFTDGRQKSSTILYLKHSE